MPSPNTLDLAKQGDPEAIATILTYHLTQRYNMTASVIRLGNYLSVLVEAAFPPDQDTMVGLVQELCKVWPLQRLRSLKSVRDKSAIMRCSGVRQ
ncbi:hypothetical protein [Leptodesmis sp.]|uniref:hypothetical protein n=1 Tax=Leptodesmis sp. TaxID=3100501 RepID=UPI00405358FB